MKIDEVQLAKFGKRIKAERISLKLSQAKLASMVNRDTSTISRWEKGERNPTQQDLLNLSLVLPMQIQTLQSLAGHTPEFDWLASFTAPSGKKGDILKTANESEKEQLRQYLHYIRFHDQVKKTAMVPT
jgi:transcriptional regulator with XRE-family HTH domain